MAFKPLNWLELERVTRAMSGELSGTFVEKVIVAERPRFPEGFLKDEWCLRLAQGSRQAFLLASVRPRHPYLVAGRGKGPKSAAHATRSGFGLQLAKILEGAKLRSIEALERERVVVLRFGGAGEDGRALALELIPAAPDAVLLDGHGRVVARARGDASVGSPYLPPGGSAAPADPPVRDPLCADAYAACEWVESELESEALALRRARALKEIRSRAKPLARKLEDSRESAQGAREEPDWRGHADLLKGSLGNPPPAETVVRGGAKHSVRRVPDYASGGTVEIPADPELSPAEDLERLYKLARRRDRRLSEALERAHALEGDVARLRDLEARVAAADFEALARAEAELGLGAAAAGPGGKPSRGGWSGKSFVSADGMPIWVGRTRDENMELTFKTAKGNDVWLHVRGRPGAHVVVPIPHGKTAPLETLLDAAVLAVVHSGGSSWGKTEVDYTFRKHVRRIPKSTEVTYTRSKTLLVEPDPKRLARLKRD